MRTTLTAPGWTTLVAGSWPSTPRVMDCYMYKSGARIGDTNWRINTRLSTAE